MSDMQENQPAGPEPSWFDPGKQNVQLIYILYLVGPVTSGITTIIGLVFAYLNREKSQEWIDTHYTFLIRTFWINVVYLIVCSVLVWLLIGYLLYLVVLVWYIIRCIKGLQTLTRDEPVKDIETWLI